jgi:osmotically-inducible protein OsmY
MARIHGLALVIGALLVPAASFADADRQDAVRIAASDADDSERNVRDRDGATLTPIDQGESEGDREITQRIRQAVVAQDGFSTDAKNVKIITRGAVVTLRGPVETEQEKARIEALASQAAGVQRVDNQIEIATD